jgi:D-alanyl-D-alanine carboxypeptidase
MKKCFILLAWCLTALTAAGDKIDKFVRAEMATHHIPGVALTVIQNGKRTKTGAYGFANLEWNIPVTRDTAFEIGSVTKQFTAAGIMLLQQDGKLSVDDLISKHLKETPASWSGIKIRHLLAHTSGIKSYTGLDGFELTKHLKQEQFIRAIGAYPLEFKPGNSWKYCNTGYNLLGFIIENVSGRNYWEFLGERIFNPSGMNSSTNRDPSLVITNRASGYEMGRKNALVNRDSDLTDVFAAGAIVSTLSDMAKWDASLDRDEILTAASKEQMWTPTELNGGTRKNYGFAWYVDTLEGHKNIGHSGSTSGFSSSFQRFPDDKLTIIVFCNSGESGIATSLAKRIAALCFPLPKTSTVAAGQSR